MTNKTKTFQSNLDRDLFAISLDPAAGIPMQAQLIRALRRLMVRHAPNNNQRIQ